jgi:hypothetical protein
MAIVVPNSSDQLMLSFILNKATTSGAAPTSPAGDRKLKLFSNNLVPTKTTVLGDLTEVTTAGYSDITLTGSNWTISNIDGDNVAQYPIQTFNITSSVNVYGYYITNYTGTDLIWVERFATAPFELPPGGGVITVTLKITLN